MKKFVKMSLVAAVAVAGLTTANAKSLEEAIKGVEVTGTVAYRYEEADKSTGGEESHNYYNAVLDVTVPAGDDLAMGLTFQAGILDSDTTMGTTNSGNTNVVLTGANFTYTGVADTTVTAGLQAIGTPWTVASDALGTTHSGTGIVAVNSSTPVTLVGAYFNETDISTFTDANQDIYVIGAMASVAGLNLDAFFAEADGFLDSYTIGAAYKLDLDGVKVSLEARHTELTTEGSTTDNETTYGKIKVAAGMFDAYVGYGENGSNGGLTSFDGSAKTTMEGWNTALGNNADTEYLQLSVGAKVLPSVHVSLNYANEDQTLAANDQTETYVQVKYAASKNLSTYVRLGNLETNSTDGSAGRLHIQYSF